MRRTASAFFLGTLAACGIFPDLDVYGECSDGQCLDAGVVEASPRPDATADAEPEACPASARFCASFDGEDVAEGWSGRDVGDGRSVARDPLAVAGAAMRARIEARTDGTCIHASLEKPFDGEAFAAAFDVRLGGVDAGVMPNIYVAQVQRGVCNALLFVLPSRTELRVQTPGDAGNYDSKDTIFDVQLVAGSYQRVALRFDFAAGTAEADVDGRPAVRGFALPEACQASADTLFKLGLYCQPRREEAVEVRYDRVVVER